MSRLAENPGSTRQNQQHLNNKLNVTYCILFLTSGNNSFIIKRLKLEASEAVR